MLIDELKKRNFENEFIFTATRSSGPGGQHVNKVSTRIELRFNIHLSALLTDKEKNTLLSKTGSCFTNTGDILISSQEFRSQARNKEDAVNKFFQLLSRSLTIKKKRRKTTPTKSSVEKRLQKKKQLAQIKQSRQKPDY